MAIPSASPPPASAAIRRDLADWRDERDGTALFEGLLALERSARRRRVYARLAEAERRHAADVEARLRALGVAPPEFRPSWRVRALLAWARVFGTVAVLPRVAAMEDADADAYLRRLAVDGAAVPLDEERANADALADFARVESGEAAKRVLLKVRRFVIGAIGLGLFAVSVALARNAQIEGLFFGVLTGVVVGPVTHYLLGKLAAPLAAGRVWCGWACWTAALLDQFPFHGAMAWPARRRPWRTIHLLAVAVGVALLVLVFGYERGAVGGDAVLWFVAGNLAYWTLAVALAVRHRDNRAVYAGLIQMPSPQASGTARTVVYTLVELMGEDAAYAYMAELNANVQTYTQSGTAPSGALGLGETVIALQFSPGFLKLVDEGFPIEVVFPSEGVGYEVASMSILAGAQNLEQAQALVDWMTSVRGQEQLTNVKTYFLPIRGDVSAGEGIPSLDEINLVTYDNAYYAANRERLVDRWVEEVLGQ